MKKSLFILLAIVVLVLSPRAYSDSVSGSMAVAGFDDVSFSSTGVSFDSGGYAVAYGTGGSLSNILGGVTMSGFSFANAPGTVLFTVQNWAGGIVSFTIEGLQESIVNGILTVSGYGILAETGYQATTAAFSLSASMSQSGSWTSSGFEITSAVTPEPASLLLLGTGLLMMALIVFWRGKKTHQLTNMLN